MNEEFLEPLETFVQQAAERIATLGETNAELERRVTELEAAVATAASEDGGSAWRTERAELERRVKSLVARLEELLEP
jgi:FtsZ-binding cell division protein ZapB